jgi:bla regulator protein blaR1
MSPEFIAEMAWKSAAIAGVALVVLTLLRSRSAADRAAVVRLAVVLLLLLPVVSLGLPALQVERPATPAVELLPVEVIAPADTPTAPGPVLDAPTDAIEAPPVGLPTAAPMIDPSPEAWLTGGYALGVLLLLGRLVAGLLTLRRWTQVAEPVAATAWTDALERARGSAGVARPVTLLASDDAPSPMSWGLGRPVILVDFDTLARAGDADAVLAHEMAHVARRDWAMLMLSRLAVVLFWFNPLVWLLERALIEQAEEAADLRAVGGVEPVSYARTLVACGAHAGGRMVPANSIAAGGGLARRVRAVLDEKRRLTPSGSAWTGAAMLGCVILAAPIAALELVVPDAPAAPLAPAAPESPAEPVAPELPDAPATPSPMAPEVADLASLEAEVERAVAADVAPTRLAAIEAEAAAAPAQAVEAVAAAAPAIARAEVAAAAATAAVAAIDVDDLIEMKVHGVDAAYLSQLAAIAPRLRLSVDEIVEAKIHGLTPVKLREFADVGYGRIDIDDLVAMQIHGVSPSFIRDMAAAGYRGLSADDLVALRIHGVTAERARRAAASGRRPSAEELVEMSIHGKL